MLVLTRERDEAIEIQNPDGTVLGTVTLVDVLSGRKARLGFDFPVSYAIHRREVADEIRRDAQAAPAVDGYVAPVRK